MKRRYTVSERVSAVQTKTAQYRVKLDRKIARMLSAVCVMLLFGLVSIVFTADTSATTAILGGCSSVLLYGSNGKYAVVGILSFVIGTLLALTALKLGKRKI